MAWNDVGRVTEFREKPRLMDHWINAGFFVMDDEAFNHWEEEDLERQVLPQSSPPPYSSPNEIRATGALVHRGRHFDNLSPMTDLDIVRTAAIKARQLPSRARRLPASIGYRRGPRLMSLLRMWWVLLRNPHATIKFGKGNYLGPGFSLHMPYGGTFITGDWVEFRRKFRAELGPNGRIEIGSLSYMTYDVIITCDTSITIGERCGLGQCAYVVDGNHRYRDLETPMLQQGYDYRNIHIEDDAQIFSKCTITNSVGKRSIIGANSVVVKPVPPFCLAAGVPARVIDYFGPPGGEPSELSESNSDRSG